MGLRSGMRAKSHPFSKALYFVTYDAMALFFAFWAAVALRLEFDLAGFSVSNAFFFSLAFCLIGVGLASILHLYSSRFIQGSVDQLFALSKVAGALLLIAGGLNVWFGLAWELPRSTALIATPIFLLFAGALRFAARLTRIRLSRSDTGGERAIVYGAGAAAEALIPQLVDFPAAPFVPVAMLDDSLDKSKRWIRGVPTLGRWSEFPRLVRELQIDVVIVAIPSAESPLLERVHREASALNVRVVVFPSLSEYLTDSPRWRALRDLGIEDLVGRQPVGLDRESISSLVSNRRVLVTGAGGSIGSELVRQLAGFEASEIIMVDRDETNLLDCQLEVKRDWNSANLQSHLLDIRDREAVFSAFALHKPEIVFHAAALKHLSMLEAFPSEAWKTNVEGTLTVLEAAESQSVSVFVNISTDKAANPVNVLGRSKHLGERLTAWFGQQTGRPFVSVRFGNVLGSRGSLLPILADQISAGGPITLTDAGATRYFMSIPEASQLVLQAAAAKSEGVMVLDMGEPVKILDIANRMIALSGKRVEIQFVGLRAGEKLHEDLVSQGETVSASDHPKITRIDGQPLDPKSLGSFRW